MHMIQVTFSPGSSPLARGLQREAVEQVGRGRIIPARAGFTMMHSTQSSSCADHPRSRGVYETEKNRVAPHQGSSPLARGLLPGSRWRCPWDRIIPARAGFTTAPASRPRSTTDHPRSRGVYDFHTPHPPSRVGSSPLARGLPRGGGSGRPRARIIPARAGFTMMHSTQTHSCPDHPRSRGVYKTHDAQHTNSLGSSPLARGLH